MQGKTHLSHLFNFNKSTQMKPSEFLDLIDFIEGANGVISPENFSMSEKVDGSTTIIGYDDEGLFSQKCGFGDKLFRKGDEENGKAAAFLEVVDNPAFKRTMQSIRAAYDIKCVRVQIEMLLTEFSRSSTDLQVVLVPYKKENFGPKGGCFIVRVLDDDLHPIEEDGLIEEICKDLTTPEFIARPLSACQIDYEPFNISGWLQDFNAEFDEYKDDNGIINPKNKEVVAFLRDKQRELQNLLTSHFTSSKFGDFYEGIVVNCANGISFKMTSEKFKEKFAEFNSKGDDVPIPEQTGVWPVQHMAREILVNHIGDDCEPVGCLMGHFAPFTGPKGHGRMITYLAGLTNKFIIGVPATKQPFDEDRNMFTPEQRVEIINDYLKENHFDGKAVLIRPDSPARMCVYVLKNAVSEFGNKIRPVFIVGPDRAEMLKKYPDYDTDKSSTFPEKIVMTDRGENSVSGTMIREYIKKDDAKEIARLTGYSIEIAEKLISMYEENKSNN